MTFGAPIWYKGSKRDSMATGITGDWQKCSPKRLATWALEFESFDQNMHCQISQSWKSFSLRLLQSQDQTFAKLASCTLWGQPRKIAHCTCCQGPKTHTHMHVYNLSRNYILHIWMCPHLKLQSKVDSLSQGFTMLFLIHCPNTWSKAMCYGTRANSDSHVLRANFLNMYP